MKKGSSGSTSSIPTPTPTRPPRHFFATSSTFMTSQSKTPSRRPTSPKWTTGETTSTSSSTRSSSTRNQTHSALHEIDFFLGRNYLVTYHNEPIPFLDQDRKNIERDPANRLRNGADHLLYHFLDLAVADFLPAIEHLDDAIDCAQDEVFRRPTQRTLKSIFRVKRAALRLHRMLAPEREVLNRLARDAYEPIHEKHRVYFRDVYDHLVRIHDFDREPPRPDLRRARHVPLGDLEPHQRYHEDAHDRHRDVHADVVSDRLLRHELLRRDPCIPVALPKALSLVLNLHPHGGESPWVMAYWAWTTRSGLDWGRGDELTDILRVFL